MKYIQKDITTVDRGVIAQGVNCQGAMGSGVALAILKRWPLVLKIYKSCPTGGDMLGMCHMINVGAKDEELYVANCYTQEYFGPGDKEYADQNAILKSLEAAFEWADVYEIPLYMPKIGAGLGGLDWETQVEPLIQRLEDHYPLVDAYICVLDDPRG